jgi:molybdenum cofactor biosynthesis protein B
MAAQKPKVKGKGTIAAPAQAEPPAQSGPAAHRHDAHKAAFAAGAAVITVSSTRTEENDTSGALIAASFQKGGHRVLFRRVVKDDIDAIRAAVRDALLTPGVDVVVTTGGTGMTQSDVTVEALLPLIEKRADGWGDVFRAVSREEIGNAALLTRSVAGITAGRWVIAIPGSEGAARMAMSKIILPELEHLMFEARR